MKKTAVKVKREFHALDEKNPLIGEFVGAVPGKFGELLVFNNSEKPDEQTVMPNYTALNDVPFEFGKSYEINYIGEKKSKSGQEFHDFTVYELSE